MHLSRFVLTVLSVAVATPVSAQLITTPPIDTGVIDVPPIQVLPQPITVDTPVTTPITIDPDIQQVVAPIIPDTIAVPTTPVALPTVGQVIDLTEEIATPIVDAVGSTVDDVVVGPVTALPTGEQIIPLIDPITQDIVGTVDPVTGAIAKPNGEVVGNINQTTNQGGVGGTGGTGSGGAGTANNSNRVTVNNRNTFIAIPQPALGSDGKTTTEVIEEVDKDGIVRTRTITTGYNRSVPTLSISGGYAGGEGLGLVQFAIPLK